MSVLSAEAVKKLQAVRDAILAEPKLYDQNDFGVNRDCGSPCCIAGWALWLESPEKYMTMPYHLIADAAQIALGIPDSTRSDDNLFCGTGSWPMGYGERLEEAISPKARARVAADYINFLIERDGPQETA